MLLFPSAPVPVGRAAAVAKSPRHGRQSRAIRNVAFQKCLPTVWIRNTSRGKQRTISRLLLQLECLVAFAFGKMGAARSPQQLLLPIKLPNRLSYRNAKEKCPARPPRYLCATPGVFKRIDLSYFTQGGRGGINIWICTPHFSYPDFKLSGRVEGRAVPGRGTGAPLTLTLTVTPALMVMRARLR